MEFSPFNNIVKLCLRGMQLEETGNSSEASKTFLKAWTEATEDFEKFLTAYFIARHQTDITDRLKWFQTALEWALTVNDASVKPAYPALYESIAECYAGLNDSENAQKNYGLANSCTDDPSDSGPFYHGTKADLGVGDFLTAGYQSNYQADLTMNHIYFTAIKSGAGLAATLSKAEGRERVYIVEPTGNFENDPNVTNKKFPGNPTRSYRTLTPLKIVGEIQDWKQQEPDDIQKWREKLDNNKGAIIN